MMKHFFRYSVTIRRSKCYDDENSVLSRSFEFHNCDTVVGPRRYCESLRFHFDLLLQVQDFHLNFSNQKRMNRDGNSAASESHKKSVSEMKG